MTQTKASRKRGHQDLEEEGDVFFPSSKRRDFNFSGPTLQTNGHGSTGHDEVDAMQMQRQHLLQAGGSDSHLSASPKMLAEGGGGPIVTPSTHPSQLQFIPPHHQQQLQHHPCSPTPPHNAHGGHLPATHLSSGQINFHASTSSGSCDGLGMPNIPVSPAHQSAHDFSHFNSFTNSKYEDINRILRDAHFNRITRINGVELSPSELHL